MVLDQGRELSLAEASAAFANQPDAWQLASLHPEMVHVDRLRDTRLQPVHWSYEQGAQRYLHSFHLSTYPALGVADIQSPYGYGGPLANTDEARFLEVADRAFADWVKQRTVVAEFLRFHPLVPHALWYAGNASFNRDTICVDLVGDLFSRYAGRRRTDVRRFAESGLEVVQVTAVTMSSVFPDLYHQNMQRVGALAEYFFPREYFDALLGMTRTESWLVYLNDVAVAGAIFLKSDCAGVVEYHLSAVADGAERLRPMIGLLHHAALSFQAEGYGRLFLGGGRSTRPDDSLLHFKQGFSAAAHGYSIGSRVHDARRYAQLRAAMPDKADSGRVLFYRD